MRIHEAASAVGCTQRAIKFYEEKGLLPAVKRCENGYRDYSEADIARLHEIQAYRKLGISLADIKAVLSGEKQTLLLEILERKRKDAAAAQLEIAALESFLAEPNTAALDEQLDFESIGDAIRAQLPGAFGSYLSSHFAPYLQIRITSEAQRDAYARILAFWDQPNLRLPFLFRLQMMLLPAPSMHQIDDQIQSMLNPSEAQYAQMKAQTLNTVRMRQNPLVRFNPIEVAKRSMMRRLRDCGYYDIFIPQMKRLSPTYKAYQDALTALNARLCEDLGLYYDSDFNLRLKKTAQ